MPTDKDDVQVGLPPQRYRHQTPPLSADTFHGLPRLPVPHRRAGSSRRAGGQRRLAGTRPDALHHNPCCEVSRRPVSGMKPECNPRGLNARKLGASCWLASNICILAQFPPKRSRYARNECNRCDQVFAFVLPPRAPFRRPVDWARSPFQSGRHVTGKQPTTFPSPAATRAADHRPSESYSCHLVWITSPATNLFRQALRSEEQQYARQPWPPALSEAAHEIWLRHLRGVIASPRRGIAAHCCVSA